MSLKFGDQTSGFITMKEEDLPQWFGIISHDAASDLSVALGSAAAGNLTRLLWKP